MKYRLQWRPYRRSFAVPLHTAHGTWYEREGLLVRLERADGAVGWGEVAALPAFGSETNPEAIAFLQALGEKVEESALVQVPESLPATAWALGSARWQIEEPTIPFQHTNAALLPSGEAALAGLRTQERSGFTTFKLKIGLAAIEEELSRVEALLAALPWGGRLRLDANGSLDEAAFRRWSERFEEEGRLGFLEQPFAPSEPAKLQRWGEQAAIPLALDESVSTPGQLAAVVKDWRWPGALVAKASLLGDPQVSLATLAPHPGPVVASSVFETAVGLHSLLRWAARLPHVSTLGCGTLAFFADGLNGWEHAPVLRSTDLEAGALERVWQQFAPNLPSTT